jgi:ribosome-binding protein aMBF1 (putative translation factor)
MTKDQIIKRKLSKLKSFDEFHREQMKDPEFRRAYLALKPEYDLIKIIIRKRINGELTQKQLAKKLGTKQSAISRFESGRGNPTVLFLYNIADALGIELKISIVKKKSPAML